MKKKDIEGISSYISYISENNGKNNSENQKYALVYAFKQFKEDPKPFVEEIKYKEAKILIEKEFDSKLKNIQKSDQLKLLSELLSLEKIDAEEVLSKLLENVLTMELESGSNVELFDFTHETAMLLLDFGNKLNSDFINKVVYPWYSANILLFYCRNSMFNAQQLKELILKQPDLFHQDNLGRSALDHLCYRSVVDPEKIKLITEYAPDLLTKCNDAADTPLHNYLKHINSCNKDIDIKVVKLNLI